MIIRLLDDSTLPEDKVIMSVPDAKHAVKTYLPAIKQKLSLTLTMDKYTIWHVVNGRKADTSRAPIDKTLSWAENGVVDKGFIYVKEKSDLEPESAAASPIRSDGGDASPPMTVSSPAVAVPPPPPPRPTSIANSTVPPPPPMPGKVSGAPSVSMAELGLPSSTPDLWSRFAHSQEAEDTSPIPPPPSRPVVVPSSLTGVRPPGPQFGKGTNNLAAGNTTGPSSTDDLLRRFGTASSAHLFSSTPSFTMQSVAHDSDTPSPPNNAADTYLGGVTANAALRAAQDEVAELKVKLASATNQVSDARAATSAAEREARTARDDLDAEVRRHAATRAEVASLRDQLDAERRRTDADTNTLRAEIATLRKDAESFVSKKRELEEAVQRLTRQVSELTDELANAKTSKSLAIDADRLSLLDDRTKQAAAQHIGMLDEGLERRRRQVAETLSLYEYAHNNVETMRARALAEKDRQETKQMLAAHRATMEATLQAALAAGGRSATALDGPAARRALAGAPSSLLSVRGTTPTVPSTAAPGLSSWR